MNPDRWRRWEAHAGSNPGSVQAAFYRQRIDFASDLVMAATADERIKTWRHVLTHRPHDTDLIKTRTEAWTCSLYCAGLQMTINMGPKPDDIATMLRRQIGDVLPQLDGQGTFEVAAMHRVYPLAPRQDVSCSVCGTAIPKAVLEPRT